MAETLQRRREDEVVELESFANTPTTVSQVGDENPISTSATSLPPDRGFHAYAYLFAHWALELLVWSYAFSYGVFLPYYTTTVFPSHSTSQKGLLTVTGTVATGLMYVAAMVILNVCTRWPHTRRKLLIGGLVTSVMALVGSAFATEPWHLLVTWGFLFAIGGSALYYPANSYLFEWFVERRGLANGIILSGTGVGGIVMPLVSETLLRRYGHRTTLLAMAGIFCGLVLPVLPFVKSRFPDGGQARARQAPKINTSVLGTPAFWILMLSVFFQSLANSIPALYLPTFALDLRLGGSTGVLVLSLLNGAGVPGRIFIGWLSDRVDLRIPISFSCISSGLAILFLWGFAQSAAPLTVFALTYGFFASGFSSMWPRFVTDIVKENPHTSYFLLSTFFAARGSAVIASGPISSGILGAHSMWSGSSRFGYGLKSYGTLILFTGLVMLASSIGIAYRMFNLSNAGRRG